MEDLRIKTVSVKYAVRWYDNQGEHQARAGIKKRPVRGGNHTGQKKKETFSCGKYTTEPEERQGTHE